MGRFLNLRIDTRPRLGSWAPGDYTCQCVNCGDQFVGDKRAVVCAECAYNNGWRLAESAPKDGTHILACRGPYNEHWGFDQSPPAVVHYWSNPGEEGFYLSHGLVDGSYNDAPFEFTHWRKLAEPPASAKPL